MGRLAISRPKHILFQKTQYAAHFGDGRFPAQTFLASSLGVLSAPMKSTPNHVGKTLEKEWRYWIATLEKFDNVTWVRPLVVWKLHFDHGCYCFPQLKQHLLAYLSP